MKPSVAIIGMGHVGKMMSQVLRPHADLVTYDVATDTDYPERELAGCSIALVCVGTPSSPDGSADISDVLDAVSRVPVEDVLLKSTVPPGTTDYLIEKTGKRICFSPEYFGETTFYNPFWENGPASIPFLIVGGEEKARHRFIDFLLPMLGPNKVYFQCGAVEAELIKYLENSYIAAKVCLVNEFRKISETLNADWHTIREGWLLDPRVSPYHTAAFSEAPGFGGKCLPKDLRAIIRASIAAGYDPALLSEILSSNQRFRRELE